MENTDLKLFMAKLKRLIDDDSHPLIGSNPYIQRKIPEIILLHEALKDVTLDDEQLCLHELEYVRNWKKRVVDVANEAEDIVDKFISYAILKNEKTSISFLEGGHANVTLNLKHVMDDIKSFRNELKVQTASLMSNNEIHRLVKIDMKLESEAACPQPVGTSSSRNTARVVNPSRIKHEEVIVGFDEDARSIMDRLVGDCKQLEIISIVGMGGLGKTTLATKVFNDRYIEYHFHLRGWVTVSQAYTKRDLLKGTLESIGKSIHEATTDPVLRETLYKSLKGRRYLIVIDDIWSAEALNDLRRYLPDDNTGSRILLTTRLTEVAWHASRGGFTHNLQCLTEEESWDLLCRKTFRGSECPESLIETGKHIAEKCKGLPLALVVIAGLLEKGDMKKHMWEEVADRVGSYVVNDPNGFLDTLALSYNHLPHHLRNCFLYVGGFPEDYKIQVHRLIRLWIAEGFIIEESGQRSVEDQAEDYLIDLVDRNLLIVADRKSDGGIKSCRLHDLLRELCLKKATEENFFKKLDKSGSNLFSDSSSSKEKHQRLFTDDQVLCEISSRGSITYIRSVLCFSNRQIEDGLSLRLPYGHIEDTIIHWVPSFVLLRVLDILNCQLHNLSKITILIHLRYLAVWPLDKEFLSCLCNLWNLQTLLVKHEFQESYDSLHILKKLVNLRHLRSDSFISIHSGCPVFFNVQSISRLKLYDIDALQSFPNVKKLKCSVSLRSGTSESRNFAILTHLESLNIENTMFGSPLPLPPLEHPIKFPETLKRLTLKGLHLPWSHMSTIQQLPNLEVLKLLDSSFMGRLWNTDDEQFCKLKFLKLHRLELTHWETSSISFPCLRKLVVGSCKNLRKIPLEIGDIPTLEHIEIARTEFWLLGSINRILEEQHALGNDVIHVKFFDLPPAEAFFKEDPYID